MADAHLVFHDVIQRIFLVKAAAIGYGIGDPRMLDMASEAATKLVPQLAPRIWKFAHEYLETYGKPVNRDGIAVFVAELMTLTGPDRG